MELKIGRKFLRRCLEESGNNAEKGNYLLNLINQHFLRWHNHLNPDIKKNKWSEDEDAKIIQAH